MNTGIDTATEKKIPSPTQHDVAVMNSGETDEQITLASSEFDQFKDDDQPTTVTSELGQSIQLKEQLKLLRIFDRKFINVNEKTSHGVISYFFKVSMLDEKPRRKRNFKIFPLLSAMLLIALAWFTFSLKQGGLPILSSPYTYTAIIALIAIGLILIVYAIKEYRNTLVFYSQHGQIPIIELLYNVPDKSQFQGFVTELIECIKIQKSKMYYSKSQILAAELTEHRKLRDGGGLTAKGYETAKNNIMKCH